MVPTRPSETSSFSEAAADAVVPFVFDVGGPGGAMRGGRSGGSGAQVDGQHWWQPKKIWETSLFMKLARLERREE